MLFSCLGYFSVFCHTSALESLSTVYQCIPVGGDRNTHPKRAQSKNKRGGDRIRVGQWSLLLVSLCEETVSLLFVSTL